MRESVFCTVAATAIVSGATLLGASGAQATPLIGSALKTAVDQQSAVQEVRCRRGLRCYSYYVSRPRARYAQPSNAWEYSPLNNSYYWGSGAMGGGR